MRRREAKPLAVIGAQLAEGTAAQTQRFFQHCIKHRWEVAGRAVDDLQDLGGGGLLLQGLTGLCQQPRVLHRNDRLCREVLQERDLLVGEREHLLAVDRDQAEHCVVLDQGHLQCTARTAKIDQRASRRISSAISLALHQISVFNNRALTASQEAVGCGARTGQHRVRREKRRAGGRHAVRCRGHELIAVERPQTAECGLTKAHRLFEHRVEHRRKVAGRRIYDAEQFGGRGLAR